MNERLSAFPCNASQSPDGVVYRTIARLPLGLNRLLCALIGVGIDFIDYKKFRSCILPVVLLGLANSSASKARIALGAAVALVRHTADVAFIRYAPASRLKRRVELLDLADEYKLVQALAHGPSGAIIVSSNFCCFYYALITPWKRHSPPDLVIVQPVDAAQSARSIALVERLSEVSGKKITVLESGTLVVGRQMLSSLRRGELVSCLIDYDPPNLNSYAMTTLLGRRSSHNSALATVAASTHSPIVPCFTFFRNGRFVTEVKDPIYCRSSKPEDVVSCCQAIDDCLSSTVAREPRLWAAWHTVTRKWMVADQPTQDLEQSDGLAAQG